MNPSALESDCVPNLWQRSCKRRVRAVVRVVVHLAIEPDLAATDSVQSSRITIITKVTRGQDCLERSYSPQELSSKTRQRVE